MYIHHMVLNSVHEGKFSINRPGGLTDYLFLCFHEPVSLTIEEKHYNITSPSFILIDSFTPHQYFGTSERYEDDYLHFAFGASEDYLRELTFPFNKPIELSKDSSIHKILEIISAEDHPTTKNWTKIMEPLFQLLIIKMSEEWEIQNERISNTPHYKRLLTIRNQILDSPRENFTISNLAKETGLSPSYFQVLYKQAFHTTCISDMIYTKIASAKELLLSTNLQVREIAAELGYNEVYHFIRQFKKHTGFTPNTFRKTYAG